MHYISSTVVFFLRAILGDHWSATKCYRVWQLLPWKVIATIPNIHTSSSKSVPFFPGLRKLWIDECRWVSVECCPFLTCLFCKHCVGFEKKKKRKIVKLVKRNVWHVKRKSTDSMKKNIYNEKLFFFTLRTCAHYLLNHFTIQQVSSFVCLAAFCNVASAHSKLCT